MKAIKDQMSHCRFAARWPMTYSNDELFGHGTILNVCQLGCRVAGTMTVEEGMRLKLLISPPNKEDALCVEEAQVLWVKDHEFGLAFQRLAAMDRRELALFSQHAERRQSFQPVLQSSCDDDRVAKPLAVRMKD